MANDKYSKSLGRAKGIINGNEDAQDKRIREFLEQRQKLRESAADIRPEAQEVFRGDKSTTISGDAFKDRIAALTKKQKPTDVLDYNEMRKEISKPSIESDTLDYSQFRKEFSAKNKANKAGRKLDSAAEKLAKKVGKGLKSIPLLGSLVGGLGALESGDAAAAIPILDAADNVGMSAIDEDIMLSETQARQDYIQSPAHRAKLEALMRMKKGK